VKNYYEELLIGAHPTRTAHPRILQAKEDYLPWDELSPILSTLEISAQQGKTATIRQILAQLVPGYHLENEELQNFSSQDSANTAANKSQQQKTN